jgi:hypothetical protein
MASNATLLRYRWIFKYSRMYPLYCNFTKQLVYCRLKYIGPERSVHAFIAQNTPIQCALPPIYGPKLSMSPRLYKGASKWTTYSPVAHRNFTPNTHSHKWIPSSPPPPSSSIPPPTRRTAEAPATPTASLPRASPSPPTRRPPGAAETPTVLLLERTRNYNYSTICPSL